MRSLPKPPSIDDKTLAAVDGQWRTAREIFVTVDEGAAVSVRHALTRLAHAGKIERRFEPHPNGKITFYRAGRVPAATQEIHRGNYARD